MCHIEDKKILCSHAGVTEKFLKENGWLGEETLDEFLNKLFKYKPLLFNYDSRDYSGYGNSIYQTPIWIRPEALKKANTKTLMKKAYIQIVGHTHVPKIDKSIKNGQYIFIDCLANKQYLVYENGKFTVGIV